MPFLLVTGYPSSGKTTIVDRIVNHLRENQSDREIIEIGDDSYAGFSRDFYTDSNKEKLHRGYLRSCVQKALASKAIVVCDSVNYIKGFRYELFLLAKLVKTTYAVLCVKSDVNTCQWLNEQRDADQRYTNELITELINRYELPDSRQRWDSPLFMVETGKMEKAAMEDSDVDDMTTDLQHPSPRFVQLPMNEIREWLCEGKALMENASTATAPIAPADLLHLLDKVTQQVVTQIVDSQKSGIMGDLVVSSAESSCNTVKGTRHRSVQELSRLRRQFLSFTKSNPVHDPKKIASLFINFINSTA